MAMCFKRYDCGCEIDRRSEVGLVMIRACEEHAEKHGVSAAFEALRHELAEAHLNLPPTRVVEERT